METLSIPDYRKISSIQVGPPSANLLATIYICQQRQEWCRDYAISVGREPLPFVGSAIIADPIEATAADIRTTIGVDLESQSEMPSWVEALRKLIDQTDRAGIMTMCSGVVLNNNHRPLDADEFRGFAEVDVIAPLIFINAAESKSAQMFVLAHELAHVWLGQSALSNAQDVETPAHEVQRWCNGVAAKLLVPVEALRRSYKHPAPRDLEVQRLARQFKVSKLVVLLRLRDIGAPTEQQLGREYFAETKRLENVPRGSGGNIYLTQASRVSKRFARALVVSTLEGHTLHRDASQMLGVSKVSTFHDLGTSLGVL